MPEAINIDLVGLQAIVGNRRRDVRGQHQPVLDGEALDLLDGRVEADVRVEVGDRAVPPPCASRCSSSHGLTAVASSVTSYIAAMPSKRSIPRSLGRRTRKGSRAVVDFPRDVVDNEHEALAIRVLGEE